jgi:uncharacterized Zn-finger protein
VLQTFRLSDKADGRRSSPAISRGNYPNRVFCVPFPRYPPPNPTFYDQIRPNFDPTLGPQQTEESIRLLESQWTTMQPNNATEPTAQQPQVQNQAQVQQNQQDSNHPSYQCKYCKKTFARAEHLSRHERSRTDPWDVIDDRHE